MLPPFIHLRTHTTFSLLEGAIPIKQLVKLCVKNQMPAVAITDSGNLFASLEFSLACADAGIQPIIGCNLFLKAEAEDGRGGAAAHPLAAADQLLVLAKDETGYRNLLALVSDSYLHPADNAAPLITYETLGKYSAGLIALTAGPYGKVGKLLATGRNHAAEIALLSLAETFPGRLYIELMRHGLSVEKKIEPGFLDFAKRFDLPIVATNDQYFIGEDMHPAHDALLCIAEGRYISEQERRRVTVEHRFKTPDEMRELFADVPEALENTAHIARRCAVMSPARAPILPTFAADEAEALRARARAGLEKRLQHHVWTEGMDDAARDAVAAPYRERLEFELDVITRMKFPGYFLIVSDFITWSKEHNIPVGPGRGSGAGSVVAWALNITDLDPLRYGLLFERFLNPERVSMPDFDIDFCQDRRDEVIAYVQQKYGRDRVAQIITFGKLQARAVLRDVGRVLQMPYGQVDRICKLVPNNPAAPVTLEQAVQMEPMLQSAIAEDETVETLVDIGKKLEGMNRHASTHAAGVVIGDRPLQELVPLYRDEKSDMLVVQYSMKYAENAGLVKFDFLGLKTLTVLQKAVELAARRGAVIDLLKLPEGDKKTYQLLSDGLTVGVFQFESAGMRDALRKLKPDCLEDLIALGALYRPGPMDNIPTYIARKHGHETPEYLHPALEEVLRETFGVIIYQEQVMQIAQKLAGYSLGEADLLRRAMGKKIRAEMEAQRNIFVERSVARGTPEAQAKSIFDLIAKFAEYGFNKSHAAAYALIAYQTAYMKANFPVEFLAASMTYDMHNTDKLAIFRQDAQKMGIALLPPCINASGVEFGVEGESIRYALAAVKNVGAAAMQFAVEEREKNGPFKDIMDFTCRMDAKVMNKRQLEHLIKAGVFDTLEPSRRRVFEGIDTLTGYADLLTRERESAQVSLFGEATGTAVTPTLPACEDWAPLERLQYEYDAIGFYLSSHPMDGYQKTLRRMHVTSSAAFTHRLGAQYAPIKTAGIVMGKKLKVSDRGRFAFLQLSDPDGTYEVSIFDEKILNHSRDLLENGQLLLITGEGKADENGARIIAQNLTPLEKEVARHQRGELRITVADAAALPPLKQLLGDGVADGLQVTLLAPLSAGQHAVMNLPGFYRPSPLVLPQIRALKGVAQVEEV